MTKLDRVSAADAHSTRSKTGLSPKEAKARILLTLVLIDILVRIYIKLRGLSPWRVRGWRGTIFILVAAAMFGFCMYCHWVHASDTIVACAQRIIETIKKLLTTHAT